MRVPVPSIALPQLLPRVEAAIDAVISLERSLRALPTSIDLLRQELQVLAEVRDDMKGMRGDIRDVIGAVDDLKHEIGRLPPDVSHLRGAVDAMYASVDRMEDQVEGMTGSLAQIDRIAGRVVNPLRRRTRRAGVGPTGVEATVVGEDLPDERLLGRALGGPRE
jgi:uncharacterized protein YoxC